jgi:hypothetical protein
METNHSLTTEERKSVNLSSQINGWGADLDPSVRPGVPRDKAPMIGPETLYPAIEQQVPYVKIHKSIEHMKMTPMFGTTCPPRGLSGAMRNFAFKFSEGRWTHWLTLLMADRVDMFEHFFADVARGHIPNIWKEMGLDAELKYNRKNFTRKVAAVGIASIGVGLLLVWNRNRNRLAVDTGD